MNRNPRIVFFGTPEFAVYSLKELTENGFNVVGVVTTPDRKAGRGMKLQASEVKNYALQKGIPVLNPEKLRDPLFLEELAALRADLQLVVAFRMLPKVVWNMPPLGTINLHAALLPQYRGAAPINWAIINGEKITGVTTFLLDEQIDTGRILLRQTVSMDEKETAGSLHDKLMITGSALLCRTVREYVNGNIQPIEQLITENTEIKTAPKINREDTEINWNKSARMVYNLIRGLSPYPGAYTYLQGKMLKIYDCELIEDQGSTSPTGRLLTDGKSFMEFTAIDGRIRIKELQIEGKKKLSVEAFLKGYRLEKSEQ